MNDNAVIKFFVYIVESPSAPDIYHKRFESDVLAQTLSLHGIPCAARTAISQVAFEAALKIGLPDEMKNFSGVPIIHISAHGSVEGIQLSDGTVLKWETLQNLLLPINKAFKNNLILCMSSCEGFAACTMAGSDDCKVDSPFLAIVGHQGKPAWSDTAVGYATFYHLIAKGKNAYEAVEGMKIAAGDSGFLTVTFKDAQKAYIDQIMQLNPETAREALVQSTELNPPPPLAKQLEEARIE